MYSGVESVDASVMVEVVFYLCADYADSRGVTQSRAGRRSRSPGAHAVFHHLILDSS